MDTPLMNVLYLLWREDIEPDRWADVLSQWTGLSVQDASRMIEEEDLTDEVLQEVASRKQISEEDIRYERLISGEVMLRENVKYLLSDLEHGEGKELAGEIDVAEETISSWRQGKRVPIPKNRRLIKQYFDFSPGVDLEERPLFLERGDFTDKMRRSKLHSMVDSAREKTIRKFSEAIKKLLSD